MISTLEAFSLGLLPVPAFVDASLVGSMLRPVQRASFLRHGVGCTESITTSPVYPVAQNMSALSKSFTKPLLGPMRLTACDKIFTVQEMSRPDLSTQILSESGGKKLLDKIAHDVPNANCKFTNRVCLGVQLRFPGETKQCFLIRKHNDSAVRGQARHLAPFCRTQYKERLGPLALAVEIKLPSQTLSTTQPFQKSSNPIQPLQPPKSSPNPPEKGHRMIDVHHSIW